MGARGRAFTYSECIEVGLRVYLHVQMQAYVYVTVRRPTRQVGLYNRIKVITKNLRSFTFNTPTHEKAKSLLPNSSISSYR